MSQSPRAPGAGRVPPGADVSKPTPARLHDYYLGGQNNLPIDRDAARRLLAVVPELPDYAWAARGFHRRAGGWLAGEKGPPPVIDLRFRPPPHHNNPQGAQQAGARPPAPPPCDAPAAAAH